MNNSQSFNSVFVRNQLKDKVCSLCLSQNRHYVKNEYLVQKIQRDFPKLLQDFNDQEERICWECNGHLMNIVRFQNRIRKARDILQRLSFNDKTGSFLPQIISLSSLKRSQIRGKVLIESASSDIGNVKQNEPLQFEPKVMVKSAPSGINNVKQNAPLQFLPKITVTSRMPAISSVSSLSQPPEHGKQNTVPALTMLTTATTTVPIEIKTEILETDQIDIKIEPTDDETSSTDSSPEANRLDLDEILESMYVQKPQKPIKHSTELNLPVYKLSPRLSLPNGNQAPILHQALPNKPQDIPANPNRITVTSGPSQKAPIGRGNTTIVVLSRTMVFELRERERIYLNNLNKTGFSCEKCIMSLKTELAYKTHMMKHLPLAGQEVCDICELRFRKKEHLNLHYKAHFRAYSCAQCRGMAFVCRHWSTMEMHLNTHEEACTCDQCGVAFKSKELLKEHKEATHMINCPQCKQKFYSQASLDEHTRFNHVGVKCKKCNLVMKGMKGLRNHHAKNKNCDSYGGDIVMIKDEGGKTQMYCGKCNKFFKTRLCLISHLKSKAHFGAWFECDYCGKKYAQKSTLSNHIEFSHLKTAKPFTCHTCGKAFQLKRVLKTHIDFVHLKKKLEAIYCCDICGKAFTSMRTLKTHQLIHSGVRAYQCDLCPWNFTQKSTLFTHMKLKHKKTSANGAAPAAASAAKVKKRRGRQKKKGKVE